MLTDDGQLSFTELQSLPYLLDEVLVVVTVTVCVLYDDMLTLGWLTKQEIVTDGDSG